MSTNSSLTKTERPEGIKGLDNLGRPTVLSPDGNTYVLSKKGTWVDSRVMNSRGNGGASTSSALANPDKVAPSKIAEYIRRTNIDGIARITAYQETIDPNIKKAPVPQRYNYINRLEGRADYVAIKEFVLEEDQKDMILRSQTVRAKAFDLLMDTLEAAQRGVKENPDDAKMVSAASGVLKSLAPILTGIQGKEEVEEKPKLQENDRLRIRAAKVVD